MTTQKAIERSTSNTLPIQQQAQQPQSTARERQDRWYYSPNADIYETPDGFTIVLDMPGVAPENVEITFENRSLIVRGRVDRQGEQPRRAIRTEYGIGDYFRRFELGDTIDTDRITARSTPPGSGVYAIHLPKFERARPIAIQVAEQ